MSGATLEYDVPVPLRDGTILRADVYRPSGRGPWPVILARGPYDKQSPMTRGLLEPLVATARGFMVIVQDTRSRFKSEGAEWRPLVDEGKDGADTVAWAASLPDSTGRVAMIGPSYLGNTQWTCAIENPQGLVAISPCITWSDPCDGLLGRGGASELGLNVFWSLLQGIDVLVRRLQGDMATLGPALGRLLADYDALATGVYAELPAGRHPAIQRHRIPSLGLEALATDPSIAKSSTVRGRHHLVQVPSFNTAGWFDLFLQGSLDNYVAAAQTQPARLIVGPWSHDPQPFGNQVQGEVNFGLRANAALVDLQKSWHELQLDWLEGWLSPEKPRAAGPKVKIFVMGVNEWRDEEEWPLRRAVDTPMYLGASGKLSATPDTDGKSTTYAYDPMNPVPTRGGNVLMSPEYPAGMFDQAQIESRADVVTFTSEPLAADLEVTGRVRACLHASTDGPSTDWVVRLCDVDEAGISRNVCDGILRAATVAGAATDLEIDLWSTSIVFRAGHRLRVQVTSSCFPRWDRNLNTGEPAETATTARVAQQTIHHGPSRIVLPVVPRG